MDKEVQNNQELEAELEYLKSSAETVDKFLNMKIEKNITINITEEGD